MKTTELVSNQDKSVNFVLPNGQECRYVRREDDYIIVYLSSHNGCNKACRFCHLTQTKQTEMVPATVEELVEQAKNVIGLYMLRVGTGREPAAKKIHFNFMARGEPLASRVILEEWKAVTDGLIEVTKQTSITDIKFNISTIMPDNNLHLIVKALENTFVGQNKPVIYYSLYSMQPVFRAKWLPKAVEPDLALYRLSQWQKATGGEIVFHWSFIKDWNDNFMSMAGIGASIKYFKINARFNLVRYNPYSPAQGEEPDEESLQKLFDYVKQYVTVEGSRIVPRVGFDVKASCGLFFNEKEIKNEIV